MGSSGKIITNVDIAAGAAIAYSKLALSGAVLNADLAGSIAYSKLSLGSSIVTGDIVEGTILAADLAAGVHFKKIAELSLGGAGTFDFTSIPTGYRELRLVAYGRGDVAATSTTVQVRINNDTGANYDAQWVYGTAASATAQESFGGTSAQIGYIPGATATASVAGYLEIAFPYYTDTTFHKALHTICPLKISQVTGGLYATLFAGWWRSTVAINRVTVFPGSGNFVAASLATLYGLPA